MIIFNIVRRFCYTNHEAAAAARHWLEEFAESILDQTDLELELEDKESES
jgi:hypothetical protein